MMACHASDSFLPHSGIPNACVGEGMLVMKCYADSKHVPGELDCAPERSAYFLLAICIRKFDDGQSRLFAALQ